MAARLKLLSWKHAEMIFIIAVARPTKHNKLGCEFLESEFQNWIFLEMCSETKRQYGRNLIVSLNWDR